MEVEGLRQGFPPRKREFRGKRKEREGSERKKGKGREGEERNGKETVGKKKGRWYNTIHIY